MIDFRFTGRPDSRFPYVDIRFRTDAISTNDQTFNILQVQEGQQFATSDKQGDVYQHFLSEFKEKNTTKGDLIQAAMDKNLDLRMIDGNGTETFLVNDASASSS